MKKREFGTVVLGQCVEHIKWFFGNTKNIKPIVKGWLLQSRQNSIFNFQITYIVWNDKLDPRMFENKYLKILTDKKSIHSAWLSISMQLTVAKCR